VNIWYTMLRWWLLLSIYYCFLFVNHLLQIDVTDVCGTEIISDLRFSLLLRVIVFLSFSFYSLCHLSHSFLSLSFHPFFSFFVVFCLQIVLSIVLLAMSACVRKWSDRLKIISVIYYWKSVICSFSSLDW